MGGAPAGELASRIAAAALEESAAEIRSREAIDVAVKDANERIFRRSLSDPAAAGMGTTITLALVDEGSATVTFGHVGDSRAYRIRHGRLEQLTDDHSLVGELVRAGRLTPQEAERHPHRAVITRAVGTEPDVEVDVFTEHAEPGDVYLLCSDGLTDMVADEEIASVAEGSVHDLDALSAALVAAANNAGGEDNVTVILFEIGDATSQAESRHEPVPTEAVGGSTSEPAHVSIGAPDTSGAAPTEMRRSGAGAGGRLTSLLIVFAVLVIALLLLAWGMTR
jgi:protein phosphatase